MEMLCTAGMAATNVAEAYRIIVYDKLSICTHAVLILIIIMIIIIIIIIIIILINANTYRYYNAPLPSTGCCSV